VVFAERIATVWAAVMQNSARTEVREDGGSITTGQQKKGKARLCVMTYCAETPAGKQILYRKSVRDGDDKNGVA